MMENMEEKRSKFYAAIPFITFLLLGVNIAFQIERYLLPRRLIINSTTTYVYKDSTTQKSRVDKGTIVVDSLNRPKRVSWTDTIQLAK